MEIVYQAIVAAGMFVMIVLFHEFGHFLAARLMGVKVEKFSIGFGPSLFRKKVGETEVSFSLIQLGGYVKLLGEDPKQEVPEEEKHRSFSGKPAGKRAVIVLAGSLFNILLALLLLFGVYSAGIKVEAPEIGTVEPGSPAYKAGIKPGDLVVSIEGRTVSSYEEAIRAVQENPEKQLSFLMERGKKEISVVVIPERKIGYDPFGRPKEAGYLGVTPKGTKTVYKQGIPRALSTAIEKSWEMVSLVAAAIALLIKGHLPLTELGGPVMIVKTVNQQLNVGLQNFIFTAAFLSINIGVFNMLPIPALDGGHVAYLLIEKMRGKPLRPQTILFIQKMGFSLLIALAVFVFYNDLTRLAQR